MLKRIRSTLYLLTALTTLNSQAALIDDMNNAREAVRTGKLDKLAAIAERVDGSVLEAYPRYWLLSAQIDQQPDSQIQRFLNDYPNSMLANRLRGDWLRSLGKRGQWSLFEREWPRLVDWENGSELHCYRLQLASQQQENAMLRESRTLWFAGKAMPEACAPVFDRMFELKLLTQEDVWARIRLALQANNPDFATQLLPRLQQADGLDAKRVQEAASKPDKLLPKLDLSRRGDRELALFMVTRAARNTPDSGAALLQRLDDKLPEVDRRYAWGRLAELAARKHHPQALAWFRLGEARDDDAQEWRVRAALRAGAWPEVAQTIQSMSAANQRKAAWRYWLARAERQAGLRQQADARFAELADEHHFYGQLAHEEITQLKAPTPAPYKASREEINALRQQPAIARALALYSIDWRLEAVREWNWAMRGLNDRQLLAAAELARQEDWYDRAIYSAERTRELHDFSLRYLTPYRDVTRHYAQQTQLDEAWVYGLMRQESRFVTSARSGVGANGLMQLMPATAKWVAKRMGMRGFNPTFTNDVGTNVQLGTYYLRHVYDSLHDQSVLATAAYNAGPGRARAWRADKPLEGAIYAESIPFKETREYVQKVLSNAVYYAQAFGKGETALKRRLGTIPGRDGDDATGDDVPAGATISNAD